MITIPMQVSVSNVLLPVSVAASDVEIPIGVATSYQMVEDETYDGSYEFTPTQETQTVQTADKVLLDDIIIHPIPQNYGLITYNGRKITVS
jgi:hypothetical protein